jgi:hypothetical protein
LRVAQAAEIDSLVGKLALAVIGGALFGLLIRKQSDQHKKPHEPSSAGALYFGAQALGL